MGKTSPIVRYKKKLMSLIVNSPKLIALVNDEYVVNGECENADDLIYEQLFPYYYIPDTQSETLAYVLMKVNGLGVRDKIYNKAEVYICAVSHQDIMKVKRGGGTRIDLMGEVIEELFNGRDDFGFGEMELKSNIETNINNTHRCRELRFTVEDFNADACNNEPN